MAEGYRLNWTYRLEPDDYPSEETARAIIAAVDTIARGEAPWNALDRLAVTLGADLGRDDAQTVAARGYMVFGFPELAPGVVSTVLNDAMRRRSTSTTAQGATTITTSTAAPKPRHEATYGFTNRQEPHQ